MHIRRIFYSRIFWFLILIDFLAGSVEGEGEEYSDGRKTKVPKRYVFYFSHLIIEFQILADFIAFSKTNESTVLRQEDLLEAYPLLA